MDDTEGLGGNDKTEEPKGGKDELVECVTALAYVDCVDCVDCDCGADLPVKERFLRAIALSSATNGGDLGVDGAKEKAGDLKTRAVECKDPLNLDILFNCFSTFWLER